MRLFLIIISVIIINSVAVSARADDLPIAPATLQMFDHNPLVPAFGDSQGITLVEFFDYQCSYCKATEAGLERLLHEDGSLRVIYLDYPKLGALSGVAATATLASLRQGADKYLLFHQSLLQNGVQLTEPKLFAVAKALGLNIDQLRQDMTDPAIAQQIQRNILFGQSVGLRVTPSFIIGGHWAPGFAPYERLKQMVLAARAVSQH